jgi:hypothetical protein
VLTAQNFGDLPLEALSVTRKRDQFVEPQYIHVILPTDRQSSHMIYGRCRQIDKIT